MTDCARISIVLTTPEGLLAAAKKLLERASTFKNRVANRTDEGYADLMFTLPMSNGHICEVQLHLAAMMSAKKDGGHKACRRRASNSAEQTCPVLYLRVRAPRPTPHRSTKVLPSRGSNPRLSRLARSATHAFASRPRAVCRRVLFGAIVEEDTYCREIKDGKPHGDGEVNDVGEREGVGVMVYASGNMYEGQWRAGEKEGVGTMHHATGNKYVGQFVAGEYEGQGTMHCADGAKYEGEYVAGEKEGKGTTHYANGDRYDGEYVADKKEGRGTFHYANGMSVVGRFKAGKDVGEGAQWSADRRTAWRLSDGKADELEKGPFLKIISLEEAARIAERVGVPVPGESSSRFDGNLDLDHIRDELGLDDMYRALPGAARGLLR